MVSRHQLSGLQVKCSQLIIYTVLPLRRYTVFQNMLMPNIVSLLLLETEIQMFYKLGVFSTASEV